MLHVVDTLGMGGVETWLMEALRRLKRHDPGTLEIHFLATSGERGIFDDEADALGARVFYLPFQRSRVWEFIAGFRSLLARERYHAIHDHQGAISGWHFLMGAGRLPPIRITHVHSAIARPGVENPRKRLLVGVGLHLVSSYATHLVGTSRQLLQDYRFDAPWYVHARKVVLHCGFDTSRFAHDGRRHRASVRREFGWPRDARVALVAGRLDPWPSPADERNWKNTAFAVDVAVEAARRDPQLRVLFAGERGPAFAVLQRPVLEAGLDDRIVFAGIRRDVDRLMSASDMLLFPSRREGLGMVAVEAQAAGLPVLASTGVPGECEVVRGLVEFMPLAAGEKVWADRVIALARQPRRVADANAEVARSPFAIEQSVQSLIELYNPKRSSVTGERTPPMRVLHIVDTLGMGGVETWLLELLRTWRGQGDGAPQIDVLATSGNQGLFDEEARALGARIFYARYGRWNALRFTREFRRILREGRYTAIHDHQGYTSGWHFLMGAGLLPPVRIAHVHNPTIELHSMSPIRALAARIGKALIPHFATHIGGTSRQLISEYGFDAPAFRNLPRIALYCGFNPDRFRGAPAVAKASVAVEFDWPADAKVVLFAGRVDQSAELDHPRNHKNSGFGVSVAIACARRDPKVCVLFVGAASAASPLLAARVAEAGLSDRIRFLGVRRDIERLMLASDALLFPSRSEGLGMVAVEAQAAGLPVVASTGVPKECVVASDLVRFLDVEAGVEAWADQVMRRLAQHRDVEAANRQVSKSAFAVENSAKALLRVYGDQRAA